MNKYLVLTAGICAALTFTSCKSSESAYKKAYEKAQAQQTQQATEQPDTPAPAVTPLETKPSSQTTVMDNVDNATVRQEGVQVIDGAGLKAYSVVVGSFSLKANAQGLQQTLKNAGYEAQIAYNADRNLYRVVASTSDSKAQAVQSRNELRAKYADAWLLFNK